jgi:hypothetical protein
LCGFDNHTSGLTAANSSGSFKLTFLGSRLAHETFRAAALLVTLLLFAIPAARALDDVHGFNFEFGNWLVHHRVKSMADNGAAQWIEFDGTCDTRGVMAAR